MKKHVFKTRVRYAEVDQMGVVYYANYLTYLESARTGLLRDEGFPYAKMEENGYLLPVTECLVKYRGSARYDEEIAVETALEYVRNASMKFNYVILNESGKTILTGHTIHACIDPDWKITAIPDAIKEKLLDYLE